MPRQGSPSPSLKAAAAAAWLVAEKTGMVARSQTIPCGCPSWAGGWQMKNLPG